MIDRNTSCSWYSTKVLRDTDHAVKLLFEHNPSLSILAYVLTRLRNEHVKACITEVLDGDAGDCRIWRGFGLDIDRGRSQNDRVVAA